MSTPSLISSEKCDDLFPAIHLSEALSGKLDHPVFFACACTCPWSAIKCEERASSARDCFASWITIMQSKRDNIDAASPVLNATDGVVLYLIPLAAAAPMIEQRA